MCSPLISHTHAHAHIPGGSCPNRPVKTATNFNSRFSPSCPFKPRKTSQAHPKMEVRLPFKPTHNPETLDSWCPFQNFGERQELKFGFPSNQLQGPRAKQRHTPAAPPGAGAAAKASKSPAAASPRRRARASEGAEGSAWEGGGGNQSPARSRRKPPVGWLIEVAPFLGSENREEVGRGWSVNLVLA